MKHLALYREWRPRTFDEVVEQQYTVAALKQAIISGNIAHAYLFSGTRGTGKTTMAQVFSRGVNCLSPVDGNPCNKCDICKGILDGTILDVIEMDAASNNNVDTIRRMCDEVIFSPSVAKYKIYIIDEVHMLSTGAFNALLKTLEEPPAHAIFILATTEPHRIPATILSRCQRYEFRRISVDSITKRLQKIAKSDGIDIEDSALFLIARISDGALRDAISLLDQASGSFSSTVTKEDILSLVGMVKDDFMNELVSAMLSNYPGKVLDLIDKLLMDGRDVVRFSLDLAGFFRNIMVCKVSSKPESILALSDKSLEDLKKLSNLVSLNYVISVIRKLSSLNSELRWSANPRITLETNLICLMKTTNEPIKITKSKIEKKEETPKKFETQEPENTVPKKVQEPVVLEETKKVLEPEHNFENNVTKEVEPEVQEPVVLEEPEKSIPKEVAPNVLHLKSEEESNELWNKVLAAIIDAGQMTVYLFLQPAKILVSDLLVDICFSEQSQMNYEEISKEKNIQVISKTLFSITGQDFTVKTTLSSGKKSLDTKKTDKYLSEEELSMESLKESAEELGIPFHTGKE